MKNNIKKLITAAITLSLGLSATIFIPSVVYADEASNQEEVGNTDNNFGKSITMYYGDFDYDGKVTLEDAKEELQIAVGIQDQWAAADELIREEQRIIGDIDGGGVSLTDATEILRMAVGIIPIKTTEVSIPFTDKIDRFKSEDGRIEAVHASDKELWKYIPSQYYFKKLGVPVPPGPLNDGMFFYDCRVSEKTDLYMKLTMMELFDSSESDLYNYDYYYLTFCGWCDKFGYENFKISLENTDTTWKVLVDMSTPFFREEFGGNGITNAFYRDKFFLRVPKSEGGVDGKQILGKLKLTYGMGFENVNDIEWMFDELDNIDELTQSACFVTDESAAPESIKDKCDFENYDYILMTIPFNLEDCYDVGRDEVGWEFGEEKKTVEEKYHSGDISKPDEFDPATYLNDETWLSEDADAKVINIKTYFTIYEQCYYEDIGNFGTALIRVDKGKYDGYKLNFGIFGEDLSIHELLKNELSEEYSFRP